ncbi:MAG: ATP phosphoribosyltransferase regulatory subunit [Pseudomonadota bacterium]
MLKNEQWILPEGISEILSPQAMAIELKRRDLLDMFYSWGYDLVDPPVIDFLDSLLTGTGYDLELMTFSLTDQMSGRLLGIRADMTPQVARIDAHHIKHDHPTRFCYIGQVLKTRLEGLSQSRSPMQLGAEIYGHQGYQSDIEIIELLVNTLTQVGIKDITLDFGHVNIFSALAESAGLGKNEEQLLFDAIQRKSICDIQEQLRRLNLTQELMDKFLVLVKLHGDPSIISSARNLFQEPDILKALDDLQAIADYLQNILPDVNLFFDLAELRGFNYHTGLVFSAYVPGHGQAVAMGGRYDGIGKTFGRSRAATGFSTDLAHLVSLSDINKNLEEKLSSQAIFAPYVDEADDLLEQQISKLRASGERVIRELTGQTLDLNEMGCSRLLKKEGDSWIIVEL